MKKLSEIGLIGLGVMETPRKVFLMVTAGKAVDEVISQLPPCFQKVTS